MTSITLPIYTSIWLGSGAVLAFFWRYIGTDTREMIDSVASRIRRVNAKEGLGREVQEARIAKDFLAFGSLGSTKEYADIHSLDPSIYHNRLRKEIPYPWVKALSLGLQVGSLGVWLIGFGAFVPPSVIPPSLYVAFLLGLTAAVILVKGFASA